MGPAALTAFAGSRFAAFRWLTVLAVLCIGTTRPTSAQDPLAPDPVCDRLRRAPAAGPINVVLVVNDTMRRDRLGAYGGPAKTPSFDSFAREGVLFTSAFAEAPWTKPSVATLFTSLYPSQHGVLGHPEPRARLGEPGGSAVLETDVLASSRLTIAEAMSGAGYRTAAFVSNPWLRADFGFAQGFDTYVDQFAGWKTTGDAVNRAVLDWLRTAQSDRPFFLYVHYIDSHKPYGKLSDAEVMAALETYRRDTRPVPEEARLLFDDLLSNRNRPFAADTVKAMRQVGPRRAFIEASYDRGIEDFDRSLGQLLAALSARTDNERTAIVVTSDHGEALFEHGFGNHGIDVFDEEIAIPMAARLPGMSVGGNKVECQVGLIDVLPTLCTYLDVPCPAEIAGQSFVASPTTAESARGRYVVAEGVMFRPDIRSLRTRRYKLIHRPSGTYKGTRRGWELYDLADDPAEQRNLLAENGAAKDAEAVRARLAVELNAAAPTPKIRERGKVSVDERTRDQLRALGYLE